VVFLGAGVSRGAGLPSWEGLLDQLSADLLPPTDHDAAASLDFLDRARLLELRSGGRARLGAAVAAGLRGDRHSLAHSLLACLPVREAATTNYDRLFELASRGAGWSTAALPYEQLAGSDRWLLKLHGCLSRPEEIVLTRTDYLSYPARRAALAGIVHALLITRHMLFAGFGLDDDNFHRIVHEVRTAVGGAGDRPDPEPFATALTLQRDPLQEELWAGDLDFIPVGGRDTPDAARRLELLLDRLLSEVTDATGYLLDPAYDGVLSPGDREVREALRRAWGELGPDAESSPAGLRFERFLAEVGGGRDAAATRTAAGEPGSRVGIRDA
jgi:hypothetical protein